MGRAFRRCSFCLNNTHINPTVVFFTVTEHIKKHLSYALTDTCYICEDHFGQEDITRHGLNKRLKEDAVPSLFPRKASVLLDHNYVSTAPLELGPDDDLFEDSDEELNMMDTATKAKAEESAASTPSCSQNIQSSGDSYHPDTPTASQNLGPSSSTFKSSQTSTGSSTCTDDDEADQEVEGASIEGSFLLVYWSSLMVLLTVCRRPGCGEMILPSNINVTRKGAAVKVKTTCNVGHEDIWESCETIGMGKWKMPSINLKIILYGFMSGMQFDKLKAFMDGCKILTITANYYYRYLKKIVYPVIWTYWLMEQVQNIKTVKESVDSAVLCGDARYDSPGFSAKYCTYFIQETTTKKILAMEVGMKGQVNYSAQMEVQACERLLNYLDSVGLTIRVFATDRSTSIRALMAKKFPKIKHQFDIWHFVKGINKRLFGFFKLKSCPNLRLWQKSVSNMIWWAISSSLGDAPLARQKILSIFHHVSNVHTFTSFPLFNKCEHEEIEEERPWIKAGSFEMQKLREAIMGKNGKNLDDLDGMDEFVHTSDLESLNSLILKYCNKTYSYSWLGMLIRCALAAIDFNANINRKSKVSADGKTLFQVKVDRAGTKVTVVEQKEKKDYSFHENIFELCQTCLERGVVPKPEYPIDPEAQRKRKHNFDKEELVKNYASRMKFTKTTQD